MTKPIDNADNQRKTYTDSEIAEFFNALEALIIEKAKNDASFRAALLDVQRQNESNQALAEFITELLQNADDSPGNPNPQA